MKNELIEASAGTGKTYALVERLVAALHEGVEPCEIVALTFSRAAAGEIFARFVRRLAENAAQRPADADLLRRVVETQHLTQIGTLDSFLMRFVQMFPLELGLAGDVSVLGDFDAGGAYTGVSLSILRRSDDGAKRALTAAFRQAKNREACRSFIATYQDLVGTWHRLYLDHPDAAGWGDAARIWPEPPEALAATIPQIRAVADALAPFAGKRGADTFIAAVRTFTGKIPKIPKALEDEPAAARAVRLMHGFNLARRLETARGLHALLAAFEGEYARRVRARGRLTFGDVPRLVASLPEAARLALEYRLDARIRQWALDEFQDTSHEQWAALGNLVDEAVQADGEKGVFVVGDCKQAIYGWRNGDVAIFANLRESGKYELRELNESYRYTQEIADAVNRVFSGKFLAQFGKWRCPEHVAHDRATRGFVHLVETADAKKESFAEPLVNELQAVRPWERGLSCAVLVRANDFGELIGTALRHAGIPATWEGESAVLDTPVLRAFTAYVKLAEHPDDALSYNHLRTTPLGRALYPDGLPAAEVVSRDALDALTTRGLGRTFQELRARLPDTAFDAFTEQRFADMLRAAAAFELSLEPGTRLASFVDYLEAEKRRDLADPGSVKIMTIHRSKGLGFDYVLLPLYEHMGLDHAVNDPLVGRDPEWVLPNPGEATAEGDPALAGPYRAVKDACVYEGLCVYYVAMTRAKRALTLILPPAPKTEGKTTKFSGFVRMCGLADAGDPAWYERPAASAPASGVDVAASPPPVRAARRHVARRMPSRSFHSGMKAGALFASERGRVAALRRGTEAHEALAQVEWWDAAAARTDLERALVRPTGPVELWRETPYELCRDGVWESGQFDRVVFTGTGADRRATIYDFKTNVPRPEETEAAFAARMRAQYAGQMRAYAAALAQLAGLPPDRIETVLLLTATSSTVR